MNQETAPVGIFKRFENAMIQWMAAHSILFLRVSVGIIFFWFGVLKFFPGQSPAANIAVRTMEKITFGHLSAEQALLILAVWECAIGIGCMMHKFMRLTLVLLFLQMLGTIMPLFLFPEVTFKNIPFVPTLEGEFILKNLIIIASAIVLLATVRGGEIISDPKIAEQAKQAEEEKISNKV